jgi:acyl-CoA thioesterase YciA
MVREAAHRQQPLRRRAFEGGGVMSTDALMTDGTPAEPRGEMAVRMLAMPADTNPAGDIFGGWLMSLMDVAGGIAAGERAGGRVATVAVTDMAFLRPVKVGDVICCYTDLARVGRTSLTLHVEAWVLRQRLGDRIKVTSADFTYVALDGDGKPRPLSP